MEIFSIGFTQTTAKDFFQRLRRNGIKRLVDVRLNNVSQLSGFAKKDDLSYFLSEICEAEYIHIPLLAPTQDILKAYQNKEITWLQYESLFYSLMRERRVEDNIDRSIFEIPSVLLCSEATAEKCHRRLVLDYLSERWQNVRIHHI